LNVRLNENEIKDLISRYRQHDGSGLINYAAFIRNINTVFTDSVNPSEVIQNVNSQAVFTDAEKDAMLEAVTQMNNQIKAQRILLKPGF